MSSNILQQIRSRKEYIQFYKKESNDTDAEISTVDKKINESGVLILNGYQNFISNFMSFNEKNDRLLLVHSTGVGKTITSLYSSINQMKSIGSNIIVIGFSKSVFKKELMNRPEFGYVTEEETIYMNKIRNDIITFNKQEDKEKLRDVKRRISVRFSKPIDKDVKGRVLFIGYKMLTSKLFIKLSSKISLDDLHDKETIDFYLKKKYIRVNSNFISQVNYSFLICDEMHNLYSSKKMNNWGICLKYLLELINSKVLFLSATPVNNKPQKIVSVINLLSKGVNYKTNDLFSGDNLNKEGLDIIKKEMTGKISYLMDKDKDLYPSKTFKGDNVEGIKYIKIVKCEASDLQWESIKALYELSNWKEEDVGDVKDDDDKEDVNEIARISNRIPLEGKYRSLNDIVYPGIKGNGIYLKEDIIKNYADDNNLEFMKEKGVEFRINKKSECVFNVDGDFLKKENIGQYSTKYLKMLDIMEDIISKGEGKTFIYHNYVQGSGTCLIKNILKRNGFIEKGERVSQFTRCSKCYKYNNQHDEKNKCQFKPLVFIYITGFSSKSELENLLDMYNSKSNINGWEIHTIVGSQAIKESYDFKCVRNMIVAFLPDNISTLIQILGRAIRKNSHKDFEEKEKRNVNIYLLATTLFKRNEKSFEVSKYEFKTNMFSKIKQINKLFIENAIDLEINHNINFIKKNNNVLLKNNDDDLDSIPYFHVDTRQIDSISINDLYKHKFYSYYFDEEIKLCIYMIKRLFMEKSRIFYYSAILDSIRKPHFQTNRNCEFIDENSVISALSILTSTGSDEQSGWNEDKHKNIRWLFDSEELFVKREDVKYFIRRKKHMGSEIFYLSIDNDDNLFQKKNIKNKTNESITINNFLNNENNKTAEVKYFLNSIKNINIESLDYIITSTDANIHLHIVEDIVIYFNTFFLKNQEFNISEYHDIYIKLLFFYNKFNIIIFANRMDVELEKNYKLAGLTEKIEKTNKELFTSSDSHYKYYQNYLNTINATEDEYNLVKNGIRIKYHLYYKFVEMGVFNIGAVNKSDKSKDYLIPIGHYFNPNVKILLANGKWIEKGKGVFNNLGDLGKKFKDNTKIIGFLEKDRSGFKISFKIRINNSNGDKKMVNDKGNIDNRKIIIGSVCEHYDKFQIASICKSLNIDYNKSMDKKNVLCDYIKLKLIKLELEARRNATNIRYFKFYWE